jgi:protein-disulfide isomerase
LGIPLAGWGLVFYCTLAALLALGWWLGRDFRAESLVAALLLSGLGAVASVLLAALMATGWVPLCPLCLLVHAINLVLVVALKQSSGLKFVQLRRFAAAGWRFALGRDEDAASARPMKVVAFLAAGLVGVVAYQWILVESVLRRPVQDATPAEALREFQAAARHELPVDATDPRLGQADAPVQLVVFLSFQCPACADLSREIRTLPEEFSRLCLVVKHFPLGPDCNPVVRTAGQPRACEAARAAVAAQAQGRFWPLHDALLQADWSTVASLSPLGRAAGLDLARFEADCASAATAAKVQADIELGRRLGVVETPAVFLNGRRVRELSPATLRLLISHELGALNNGNPQEN